MVMSPEKEKYSVVVPVYNSEGTLGRLYDRLKAVFDRMGAPFEVIFVNDGSVDGSAGICAALADEKDNVVFVDLLRNFGQHNAILCGLTYAAGDYVLTLDDDLQNPPEEIPKLVAALKDGDYEVVYGAPIEKRHQPYRNLGSRMVLGVMGVLFGKIPGKVSSFRLMTRTIKDCILRYKASFTFIDGLIFQNTRYVGFVDVLHEPRAVGSSNYNLKSLVMLATNLFFNFSIAPLRFVFMAGLTLAAGSGLFALWILIAKLTGIITFPGYASIMTYFSLLFGALFMFLGLIGEYVGRIAQGINSAPQFAVRKVTGRGKQPKNS